MAARAVATTLAMLLCLTGCTGSEAPEQAELDGCAWISDEAASDALGSEPTGRGDESVDGGGAASNVLGCRISSDGGYAAVTQVRAVESEDKALSDVEASRSRCEQPLPLDVAGAKGLFCASSEPSQAEGPTAWGVWDGLEVTAQLTVADTTPAGEEAAARLRPLVAAAVAEVSADDLEP